MQILSESFQQADLPEQAHEVTFLEQKLFLQNLWEKLSSVHKSTASHVPIPLENYWEIQQIFGPHTED